MHLVQSSPNICLPLDNKLREREVDESCWGAGEADKLGGGLARSGRR